MVANQVRHPIPCVAAGGTAVNNNQINVSHSK
jgi:hypothetical protein